MPSGRPLLTPDWPAPARVRAFSTLRGPGPVPAADARYADFNLGSRCGDDPAHVAASRAALVTLAGLPRAPVWLQQVHGCAVFDADTLDGDAAGEPQADAAVTTRPGCVLAVLHADCLPVLLASDDGRAIGAAHAGWRGLAAGVLDATVAALRHPPERMHAWLGPCAGPTRYEVDAAVRDAFLAQAPEAAAAFEPTRPGHWLCDLRALARQRLAACGLRSIHASRDCTIDQPDRYFSHRRDAVTGRMATGLWIAPDPAA